MARFAGKYANVKASGTAVPTTGEATTDVGGVHTTYQITNAAHQVFGPNVPVTVKKNGATQSPSLYTFDRLFGRVTFHSAILGTDVVTVDGSYLPMTTVATAKGFELSANKAVIDATTFASLGDTERAHGLRDASGSIDRFAQMDGLFLTYMQQGSVMVIEFWRNQTSVDARVWARFEKVDEKAGVTDLVQESITFVSDADSDGRSVSFA